ncbi:hypothetical protein FZEAL_7925 [Fusarium zealandicum]|uniref:Uncharacterized protein n=1 Tax=Fusarium zealandicum TaxID=1053134 RepID=A0A8H4UFF9_9HYPO|nr:hypothetical protein FZEAL_7925 [Fusarium zealandicum]
MVLSRLAKASALLFTTLFLPLIGAQGMPILSSSNASELDDPSSPIPGLERLLGPHLPHIDNPSQMLGATSGSEYEDNKGPTNYTETTHAPYVPGYRSIYEKPITHHSLRDERSRLEKLIDYVRRFRPQLPPVRKNRNQTHHRLSEEMERYDYLPAKPVQLVISNSTGDDSIGPKLNKTIGKRWRFVHQLIKQYEVVKASGPYHFGIMVVIVNATPYKWRKGHSHSYQMHDWEGIWPDTILPGQSIRIASGVSRSTYMEDTAAEVVYHLEGTKKPMSFRVERRSGGKNPENMWVTLLQNLRTASSPKGTSMELDHHIWPGSSHWILAGTEGDFVSMDAPDGWMSKQLSQIGHLPLREITMPRSHHSGLWKVARSYGFGGADNSQTQTEDLTFQLTSGGVRVIDIRPLLWYKEKVGYKVYAAHGSIFGKKWHGVVGASLREMIDMVNDFNRKHPGELVIFDIHAHQALIRRHDTGKTEQMGEEERSIMYDEFRSLKHRMPVSDHEDITKWPLKRFIKDETSAVLIRVPETWAADQEFPGGREGFVTSETFPINQVWSQKKYAEEMAEHQVKRLKELKPTRNSALLFADWILTFSGIDVLVKSEPLVVAGILTYQKLFYELWLALTTDAYPNWIATDTVHSDEAKNFAVAVNHCFAARRCGDIKPRFKQRLSAGGNDLLAFDQEGIFWVDDYALEKLKKAERLLAKARKDKDKADGIL